MKINIFLMCIAIAPFLMSCEKFNHQKDIVDEQELPNIPFELTKSQKKFVSDNNGFAFDLLGGLMKDSQCEGEDFMVSPLSAAFMLSALSNGAEGQTRSQIIEALAYDGADITDINEYCRLLLDGCESVDRKTIIGIHNALIVNKTFSLNSSFSQTLTSYYDAYVKSMDFSKKSTLTDINKWCEEKSAGMIPSILDQLSTEAAMIALNCIYFKARWTIPFSAKNSQKATFTDIDGRKTDVVMMAAQGNRFFCDNGTWKTLRLSFGRGSYNMFILLPNEGEDLTSIITTLNETSWSNILASMKASQIDLKLPKFETATSLSLVDVLQYLGIRDAFDNNKADFGAMLDDDIFISQIKQNSKIKIDEEGAEAAAITISHMDQATGYPEQSEPIKFYADRPFVYLIQESSSGAIFFAGVKCR